MTPFAVGGTALWALAALVTWLAGADSSTVWICVAGFLMGFPGIAAMIRHDKRRAARKAAGEVLRD
nr:DUF2530 domain-containing protein [Hamadaea tsunoensis]